MNAKLSIEVALENPYDDNANGLHWSLLAARAVIANLLDRRDIKHPLQKHKLDADVRAEMVATLAEIIREAAVG